MDNYAKPILSATLVRKRAEFDTLAQEWNELLFTSPANSIFLTFEWLSSWLDTVYPQADLFVVVVRDHKHKLVGAVPFYLTQFKFVKLITYKYLRYIGDCHSGAEYPDIIIRPGLEDECLTSMRELLLNNRNLWDCAWLPHIADWTGSSERFAKCFGQDLTFCRRRSASFSSVALPSSLEAYLNGLSKSRRYLLKRQEKYITKTHELRFEVCNRHEVIEEYLTQLFNLHGIRWENEGQQGSFVRRPLMADFYRRFAPLAFQNDWLCIFRLKLDNVIYAVQYGYVYKGCYHQVQEGFDPKISGVGNILRMRVMEWCITKGIVGYDFLGNHTKHKEDWGSLERCGSQLFLGLSHRPKNKFLALREFCPTGRFIDQGRPANFGKSH